MTKAKLAALKTFLRYNPVVKQLNVNNCMYEVDQHDATHKVNNRKYEMNQQDATHEEMTLIEVNEDRMRGPMQEDALSGTAARFFDTKVDVSNQEV